MAYSKSESTVHAELTLHCNIFSEERGGIFLRNAGTVSIVIITTTTTVPGKRNRYSWTVRGSNPGGGEIFHTHPNRPWGLPSLLYNGYRVLPGGKAAGAWC